MVDQQLAQDRAGLELEKDMRVGMGKEAEKGMEVGMGMAGLEAEKGMAGLEAEMGMVGLEAGGKVTEMSTAGLGEVGLAGEPDTVAVLGKQVTAAWDKVTAV